MSCFLKISAKSAKNCMSSQMMRAGCSIGPVEAGVVLQPLDLRAASPIRALARGQLVLRGRHRGNQGVDRDADEEQERIATKHGCRTQAGRRGCRARRIPRTGPVKKMEPATTTRAESAAAMRHGRVRIGGGLHRPSRAGHRPRDARRAHPRALREAAAARCRSPSRRPPPAAPASRPRPCPASPRRRAWHRAIRSWRDSRRARAAPSGLCAASSRNSVPPTENRSSRPGHCTSLSAVADGVVADREPQPVDLAEHARCHRALCC